MAKGQIKQKQETISKAQFEKLCGLQCTQEEISAFFGVCEDTLSSWCKSTYNKNFSEIFREKRKKGAISLRRHQWELAKKSATMAIFLGKQYLGQKDVIENTDNGQLQKVEELLNEIKNEATK